MVVVALVLISIGACVDRGGAFVADNRTDHEFVARVTGSERISGSSALRFEARQDLIEIPARTRRAIAVEEFAGNFRVHKVEILTPDCVVIATFDEADGIAFSRDGTLFVIEAGPSVDLRKEWPESEAVGASSGRCRAEGS